MSYSDELARVRQQRADAELADLQPHTLSRKHDPETSYNAGRDSRASAKAQAAEIIALLHEHAKLSNDEMDALKEWDKGTAGKRRRDVERLLLGSGFAYGTTGETRTTRRGHQGDVWTLRTANKDEAAA